MKKKVTFSMEELRRLEVIQKVENKWLTGKEAAKRLRISERQVRRLIARYREQGPAGLVHGNRGRIANNCIPEEMRTKVLELAEDGYRDYNDSHFTEELAERHGIDLSRSTVRRIRREAGLSSPRKRRSPRHRRRRERREKAGMLLQTDGSRHDWLEGRGPWLTLIAYIDDATNEVMGATFRDEEDAAGYFLGLQEICMKRGIPGAIYADRHTIFQSPLRATIEQELNGEQPRSQFGRLLDELGIELISARSPQAKGRIERLWGVLQDRLVKALREAGAASQEEANQILEKYLPKHNQRFMREAAKPGTTYLPWPQEYQIKDFFCFKHKRMVSNDNTFSFDGHRFQIPPGSQQRSYARASVDVLQHLNGQLEVRYQGNNLATFQQATGQPVRVKKFEPAPGQVFDPTELAHEEPAKPPKPRKPYKPAANHPWRRYGQPLKGRKLG
jgi:transposase